MSTQTLTAWLRGSRRESTIARLPRPIAPISKPVRQQRPALRVMPSGNGVMRPAAVAYALRAAYPCVRNSSRVILAVCSSPAANRMRRLTESFPRDSGIKISPRHGGDVPIVFVHGVNTRKGPAYDAGKLVIDAFVRKHLSGATIGGRALAQPVTTYPYWGDLGMTFAYNMASLPRPQMQALGGTADIVMQEILGARARRVSGAAEGRPADGTREQSDFHWPSMRSTISRSERSRRVTRQRSRRSWSRRPRTPRRIRSRRGSRRCNRIRTSSTNWPRRFSRAPAFRRSAASVRCSTRSRPRR